MTLLAGAAAIDISPTQPLFLLGYPHVERTSTGVHDPLLASALVLRDDQTTLVLVSLDLLFANAPTARLWRRAVAKDLGIPEAHVFISCTHTHSAPVTATMLAWRNDPVVPDPDPAYMSQMQAGLVEAAAAASRAMRPAEAAWATATAEGVGGNRLGADGPTDPEAGVLAVRDRADGRPIALSITYSMHPTVLHEDSTLVCSDFPGYARSRVQQVLGEGLPVLYHTGPAGDQSPRRFVTGQTFAEAERLGRQLGDGVLAALEALPESAYSSEAPLSGELTSVRLTRRRMPTVAEARQRLDRAVAEFGRLKREGAGHGPVRTAECAVFGAEEAVTLAEAEEQGELDRLAAACSPADVQVVTIGPACLVGLPGELFVEYGLELKRRSPRQAFVVSLVNGELQGYIVTPAAAAVGGYEAALSLFGPDAGRRLVEAALSLIR